MKKLIFAVAIISIICGCQHPIIKPVDVFVNKTAGPELEYYWKNDLKKEKKFVKTKDDLKARTMNLKTMRILIERAKKNER